MTLAEILDVVVPRGWFLPVVPGTRWVTVGGAIANDIHGKNHHRAGTFGAHVTRLELLRSTGERLICSPDDETRSSSRATIGGLGLTGLILWAEIRLQPVAGRRYRGGADPLRRPGRVPRALRRGCGRTSTPWPGWTAWPRPPAGTGHLPARRSRIQRPARPSTAAAPGSCGSPSTAPRPPQPGHPRAIQRAATTDARLAGAADRCRTSLLLSAGRRRRAGTGSTADAASSSTSASYPRRRRPRPCGDLWRGSAAPSEAAALAVLKRFGAMQSPGSPVVPPARDSRWRWTSLSAGQSTLAPAGARSTRWCGTRGARSTRPRTPA